MFFALDQMEELVSKTEAKRRNWIIPAGAQPVKILHAKVGGGAKSVWYDVYRASDCQPDIRKANAIA